MWWQAGGHLEMRDAVHGDGELQADRADAAAHAGGAQPLLERCAHAQRVLAAAGYLTQLPHQLPGALLPIPRLRVGVG